VTGGSGGIGGGICKRLAGDGFQVVVHYGSSQSDAEAVVEEIESNSGSALAVQADVTEENAVIRLFEQTLEKYDGVDVVVVNAGVGGGGPIGDSTLEVFEQVVGTNLRGAFLTLREAARRLNDNGRIVFISSQLARHPMAGTGIYAATKAGMDAMVVAMSKELGDQGITVNSVQPGATVPGMFASSDDERKEQFRQMSPFKRLGHPEDIAAVVSFLVGDDGHWVTGQHLRADGGASN